jgi:hypothetical protein
VLVLGVALATGETIAQREKIANKKLTIT